MTTGKELVSRQPVAWRIFDEGSWAFDDAPHTDWEPLVPATALTDMERERDEARAAEEEAKDCFWAVYPTYCQVTGHGISTEAARTELAARNAALEAEVVELRKALEPFADEADRIHPDWANERRRSTLTRSKELTVGDFRRARTALQPRAST